MSPPNSAPSAPPARPVTPSEVAQVRAQALADLTQAADDLTQAAAQHEEFRTTRWLPTPRRRRFPLIAEKDALRAHLDQARARRDALLTAPLTLVALTPAQREQATGLSRQGRRLIERAAGVTPVHPHWATHETARPRPRPQPHPEETLTP